MNILKITINKPIEEVFEFTTNPGNTHKWVDFIETEETSEWPLKVGTIYRNKGSSGEWSEFELVELEPNKLFTLQKKDGSYSVRYTYTSLGDNETELEYAEWVRDGELEEPFTIDVLEGLKAIMES